MAVLSLGVAASLLVVLIVFVRHMAASLRRTGQTLLAGVDIATTVRKDCEQLVGGILALNRNLVAAAAALTTVADSAHRRATKPPPARTPAVAPARSAPPIRDIREPSAEKTFERVGSWTIRDPSAPVHSADDADSWAIREPRPSGAQATGRHSKEG